MSILCNLFNDEFFVFGIFLANFKKRFQAFDFWDLKPLFVLGIFKGVFGENELGFGFHGCPRLLKKCLDVELIKLCHD